MNGKRVILHTALCHDYRGPMKGYWRVQKLGHKSSIGVEIFQITTPSQGHNLTKLKDREKEKKTLKHSRFHYFLGLGTGMSGRSQVPTGLWVPLTLSGSLLAFLSLLLPVILTPYEVSDSSDPLIFLLFALSVTQSLFLCPRLSLVGLGHVLPIALLPCKIQFCFEVCPHP